MLEILVDLHEVYLAHRLYLHYNLFFFFLQSSTFHNIKIKIRLIIRHIIRERLIFPWYIPNRGQGKVGFGWGGGGRGIL